MENLSMKKRFWIGLVFDVVGMLSFFFPIADVVWAPLSAYLMVQMYPGTTGKVDGVVSFLEEAIPGLDFFPSFTLTWLYSYYFEKRETTRRNA
jgi:hypothetical protein